MGTWNSRGLRGSTLEELINRTNEQYREKGLALIQKIPTPITPIKIDKEKHHITLAYTGKNLILYLPFKDMMRFWERAESGGRKSFRFEEVDLSYQIEAGHGVFVPYLEAIQKDLDARD